MEENEIELMDYLNIIWKRKWLIIIPTFFFIIAAGVISFLLPQVWEIDAVIVPSKFLVQTTAGDFEEVVIVSPKQIAGQINQASYNRLIAVELNLDIREIPKLRAENLKDTDLVRLWTREKDVEKAKLILTSLLNYLKKDLDRKAEIEIKGIDAQIKSNEIEKLKIEEEIKTSKKMLNIVKQRKKEIEEEMSDTKKLIEELKEGQRLTLKKEQRSEAESLAMLLYSNVIQQSLRYHNTLNELLTSKKIGEENINLEIENKGKRINQLEVHIDDLIEKKGRIDYTQIVKEPISSNFPVSPRKKLNVMIAGILGLMIFTILAFFLEYIKKQKLKSKV